MNNLTSREREIYSELFSEMDTDKSGHLCVAEVESLCARLGFVFDDSQLQELFGQLDKDKNGSVSLEEFLNVMQPIKKKDKGCATIRRMFRKADTNKDGFLTLEELHKALNAATDEDGLTVDKGQVEQLIRGMDTNNDGVLDYEEFVTLLKSIL